MWGRFLSCIAQRQVNDLPRDVYLVRSRNSATGHGDRIVGDGHWMITINRSRSSGDCVCRVGHSEIEYVIKLTSATLIRPEVHEMNLKLDGTAARIQASDMATRAASRLLLWSSHSMDEATFLESALSLFAEMLQGHYAAVVQAERGQWKRVVETGEPAELPIGWLADILDDDMPSYDSGWYGAPLVRRSGCGELLAVYTSQQGADVLMNVDGLAALLGKSLGVVRCQQRSQQRIERLEAILQIAGQWSETLEMETLLTRMAETSTQLLNADRASIFLWDKSKRMLVGRPALGVEDGELRIADDTGIVGQVVQTGESRRVDLEIGQDQIDRQVDRELGFQTHTLLCVPLRTKGGELFGAFEMINKLGGNFTDDDEEALTELAAHASIALANTQQVEQLLSSRQQMAEQAAERVKLIGESQTIETLRDTIQRVANTDLAILILGENGTGKEVVSQAIHYLSDRRNEPFVAVNCAALTETLLESELFGHEKGAFTDAHESRAGKFELASGGTLFLDEIGDLSVGGQAKMLRVLEEKIVVPVGGSVPIHTNTRVVAATNQDLALMVREKRFREDLYFRLNVVVLELPPLRDRGGDIQLLAEHFLREFCVKARRPAAKFTSAAKKRLREHSWPGNVRELRNLMERLAYLAPEEKIDAEDLAFILAPGGESPGRVPLDLTLSNATGRFQLEYIKKHIESSGGNLSDAARRLGLHRSNLYRKMRQLGVNVDEE